LPPRKLERVLAYVRERLGGDLTLSELATVAGLSPSRFKALFRQSMGVSVHQYVLRRRIERAAELLTRTRAPLCDVALQAGFANQSHMAAMMRRSLGVTPKALRDAV
jgi:AraC family transcriptional regulator